MRYEGVHIAYQVFWLLILAIPIACVARTVTYEEVFREAREYCERMSLACRTMPARKFFYLFTCEYCFSHWVTLAFLGLTALGPGPGYRLLIPDWRGYLIAFFALVFVANSYLNLYSRLRVDITSEKKTIEVKERQAESVAHDIAAKQRDLGTDAPERTTARGDGR